jgi:hypothetical protein
MLHVCYVEFYWTLPKAVNAAAVKSGLIERNLLYFKSHKNALINIYELKYNVVYTVISLHNTCPASHNKDTQPFVFGDLEIYITCYF